MNNPPRHGRVYAGMIGSTLGHYRVIDLLGRGGMGEVYRARDTTLDRDVALKMLPPAFASDADRLARFEREAKTLAALNHPHIAHIHGIAQGTTEDGSAFRALVMEFVDGEDLSDRIAQGPIPMDEALPIARQIAEALEAAHNAGIVHRDLKPANIKLGVGDGGSAPMVKVLDFGLAKAVETRATSTFDRTHSPTITTPAMTAAGLVLGTAAYMAPEQAKGRPVDKRADIWAFGVVLYEMLTGARLFGGEDVSETLAAILRQEPDWARLPSDTPPSIHRLLRRCLVRDPHGRLPDMGTARLEIDEGLTTPPGAGREIGGADRKARRIVVPALTLVAGLALGIAIATLWNARTGDEETETRAMHVAGAVDRAGAPRLSPDGKAIAFVRDGRLVVRRLDSFDEVNLQGTESASNPFWSPDSAAISYFAEGRSGPELRTVAAAGGASRVVVQGVFAPYGATYCRSGIVFARFGAGLLLLSQTGQEQPLVPLDRAGGETNLAYPHCLADDRLLVVVQRQGKSSIAVLDGDRRTELLTVDAGGNEAGVHWPAASASGHVLFYRTEVNPGVWAAPVDPGLTRVTGGAQLVLPGARHPSVSRTGLLVALSGVVQTDRQLVWVDRAGKRLGVLGQPQAFFASPSIAPDGRRVVAAGRRGAVTAALWIHGERTVQRWTAADKEVEWVAWSPRGDAIAYVERDQDVRQLFVRALAGTPRKITERPVLSNPAWTPDGRSLVYQSGGEVWMSALEPDATPRQLLANAQAPAVSPDGKLLAYVSDETGRRGVYLTTFPTPTEVWPVSQEASRHPRWNARTGELFFLCGPIVGADPNSHRHLCAAHVEYGNPLRIAPTEKLFEPFILDLRTSTRGARGYDVAADGRILVQTEGLEGTPSIVVIENLAAWIQRAK